MRRYQLDGKIKRVCVFLEPGLAAPFYEMAYRRRLHGSAMLRELVVGYLAKAGLLCDACNNSGVVQRVGGDYRYCECPLGTAQSERQAAIEAHKAAEAIAALPACTRCNGRGRFTYEGEDYYCDECPAGPRQAAIEADWPKADGQ